MDKKQMWHVWYFLAAIFGIIVLQQLWAANQALQVIPYSEFLDDLKAGKIAQVRVSGDYIEGDWKQPVNGKTEFVTTRVPPDIASELAKYNVQFSGEVQSTFLSTLLSWVVPTLLFFGIWVFWFRRLDVDRPQQGEDLCRERHQDDLQRCRRRRRSQGGACRNRAVPQGSEGIRPARRASTQGRAFGRSARHRQDAVGTGGRR